jgi:hypothetical protein
MSNVTKNALGAIWGAAVIVFAAATWALSFWRPGSQQLNLSQAHALCNSALGSFAQALYPKAITACGQIGNYYEIATWARWLAVIGAAAATVMILVRNRAPAAPPAAPPAVTH